MIQFLKSQNIGSRGPVAEKKKWFSTQSIHWAESVNQIYVILVNIFFLLKLISFPLTRYVFFNASSYLKSRYIVRKCLSLAIYSPQHTEESEEKKIYIYWRIYTYIQKNIYNEEYIHFSVCYIYMCVCYIYSLYIHIHTHIYKHAHMHIRSLSSPEDMLIDFRGEGREKERHQLVSFFIWSDWGLNPQPRTVSWKGIKPVTLWFVGQHPTHWATPARAQITY